MAKNPDAMKIGKACAEIAKKHSADVIVFNGHTLRSNADRLVDMVHSRTRRKNVILLLITPGGSADSAYRVARCLQQGYQKFTVLVPGWCKSAGTLCVLGAHELVMADCAELGPLDVQIAKKDELGELGSGLDLVEAMKMLRENAFSMFEDYMFQIKQRSEGFISFKMAADIATKMAIGLSEPLFRQIDPSQIGENARSIAIAKAYGARLQVDSKNFNDRALELLIESYPEHGFVIDRREAQKIFNRVRAPNTEEAALLAALGGGIRYPAKVFDTRYLNEEIKRKTNETKKRLGRGTGAGIAKPSRKQDNRGDSGRPVAEARVSPESTRKDRIRIVPGHK